MFSDSLPTPIGPVTVTTTAEQLLSIHIGGRNAGLSTAPPGAPTTPLLKEALAQLEAWLAHRITRFDLPLTPARTARGEELRATIRAIGYGETASYGEIARIAGSGPRAIGQACRRNPFPILVPCHRVIAAAQAIGYYSGGDGIATKRWLLDHESNYLK